MRYKRFISIDIGIAQLGLAVIIVGDKDAPISISEKHTVDLRKNKIIKGLPTDTAIVYSLFSNFFSDIEDGIFAPIAKSISPTEDMILIEKQPGRWKKGVKSEAILYTILRERFSCPVKLISPTQKLSFIPIGTQIKLLRSDTQKQIIGGGKTTMRQRKSKMTRGHRKTISKKTCEIFFGGKFSHDEADAVLQVCAFLLQGGHWSSDLLLEALNDWIELKKK